MFLGVNELLKLVREKKLVEDLCKRELTNPEGAGFDLRLGELFKIKGEGFLGETERKTCEIESVAIYKASERRTIKLKPSDFYLVKTIEKVNLPDNLVGFLKPRSTLHRMGLYLMTTQISPGYQGELTLALKNVGDATIEIEMGSRIVHFMCAKVEGKTNMYRGQWQGGRVTTTKKERQV